jgi:hypothetical protein
MVIEMKLTYRHLVVPEHLGTGLGDDRDIDVGTRTQIVEDTDRIARATRAIASAR